MNTYNEKVFLPQVLIKHYLITDTTKCPVEQLPGVVEEALKAGFKAVQLREKNLSTKEQFELAIKLREITAKANAILIINDRVDIYLASNADGVHLGWQSMPVKKVRQLLGKDDWIGVSAHSVEDAIKAEEEGASYVTISPIFDTGDKSYPQTPLGVNIIKELRREIKIPIVALGGINENNAKEVFEAGASGIALIRSILSVKEPFIAAKNIIESSKI